MKMSYLPVTTLLAVALLASLPLAASAATRRPPGTAAAAPQERTAAANTDKDKDRARKCNAEADGKKLSAEARRKFVANCLKAR